MTTRSNLLWHFPPPISFDLAFSQGIGGHPLVAHILAQRGYATLVIARPFLDPANYSPALPETLSDLLLAAECLNQAINAEQTILVWGDFDVDGQTSTALLVDALGQLGAQVVFYIPNRLRESHGIRVETLREQVAEHQPEVLLTCDTGVSAHAAIDYAKSQGLITLITDHHDLPSELPSADAIINPKRFPSDHPLISLPGVGVAYKLIEQLYNQRDCAEKLPQFLDLVALGIVADVAVQTHDTRYLLQLGLEQLRHTQRIGLQALIRTTDLLPERINTSAIGFQLGPRLNAAGRLDDARPVVELLTTTDPTRAHLLANHLEGLNNQRRLQNRQIYTAAQEQIQRDPSVLDWEALVLSHPAWHAGIIGIVASRLAEHYHRPVVLLSISEDGHARGSARSAPGYDIGAAIAAQSDLLIEYGGHPGAAGLSLHADNIPAFRRRLSDTLRATRDTTVLPGLQLDAVVSLDELSLNFVTELNRLAPFGEGNPHITLATCDLTLKSAAFIGRTREHRRLIVEDAVGTRQKVIWWNSADQPLPEEMFDLAYQLEISTYQGNTELQLTLVDYRRSESAPVKIERPARKITDHRGASDPDHILQTILKQHPEALIWAEGYRHAESPGIPLSELHTSNILVLYTTPTDPQALQTALECVKPTQIILLAINPPLQAFSDVFQRILQLVKFVLHHQDGQTTLYALAEAIGQSPGTIQLALEYITAQGKINVRYQRHAALTITPNNQPPALHLSTKLAALQASMAETAAYRAFFHRATPQQLLGENV